ncbi:cytochrome [Salipiger aestuarii]|uniref:Cytochrome P450 n=1 Tax=Salipiger aestuarii TaxID=568098 RepID=A0A327XYP4_9RHOB|nr:cytochrome P450 [Salipiger aestuarii]KAB2541504.1 cytochrome [Salipiger aestuarii]RAK14108.1 cytochrome P450 [Salipiger aestuarii]
MPAFVPPTVTPPGKPLGILPSLREARRNVLGIIPAIAYTQPIVTGRTGPARWHMVQGPEGMKHIFQTNVGNYPKSEVMIRMLRPAVGNSLFTSEGAAWRWQRRAIAPVFAARNVDALAPVMTATAARAADRLAASGGQAELVSEMLSATFDVICDVALSGREHFDAEVYGAAITRYFLTVGRASLLDFLEVPPWVPRPGELFGRNAVRTMHSMVAAAIDERRKSGAGAQDDLLDHMLKAKDPETGRTMSPQELLHNMQFFIVAGHETTALALSWALYLLANDSAAQDRARAEAQGVLGSRPARADDLGAMPYGAQVLDEAMRLYPPVAFLARNVLDEDRIYDRDIHAGDTVFVNIWSMQRHANYWDGPDTFNPDRFAPEAKAQRDRYLHLPFGAGPRICVGANFAMMQAQIILATLLARFRFSPGGPAPEPVMHMTVRPEPGITLNIEPL